METRKPSARRKALEWTWVVGVVAFGLARFAVAYAAVGDELKSGIIVFGLIDLVTAVPYGLATARIVTSLVDRDVRGASRWGIVASVTFLAPYVWLSWIGRGGGFSPLAYAAIGLFVVSIGTHAVISIRRRALEGRRERDRERGIVVDVTAALGGQEPEGSASAGIGVA